MSTPSSRPTGPVLRVAGVTVSFDGRPVLRDVSLAVDPGHRAGLVGENGVGKSTLLRVVAGLLDPDDGDVTRPADLGHLHQELPHGPTTTVGDLVEDALAGVRAVEAELEAAAAALADPGSATGSAADPSARYDAALARATAADVWDADARAARVLAGLRLDTLAADRRLVHLSGGQRTRLGLAALLVRRPSAVLLDEPTNHLDDDAADFLAAALRDLPGAVLLASHDRVFLDDVCTEVLDLDPTVAGGVTAYGGGFSDYLEAKRVERERWEQRYAVEQDELDHLRHSVATTARDVSYGRERGNQAKILYDFKGARVQSQVSRRVRNARLRLDTLERDQVRRPPALLSFAPSVAPARPDDEGGLAAWAHGVVVRAPGTPDAPGAVRLDMTASGLPSLEVGRRARLLLTGGNGSGKSTLLHVLAGDLAVTAGSAGTARGVRVGLLEQDVDLGDESRTPRQVLALAAGLPVPAAGERPAVDAHGLLAPRDLDRPLRDLSVGQRRRAVLAMLVTQSPDVLLLDEPTNHVSLTLADELLDALAGWPGAVVVASHDRWLRRRWTGDVAHLAPRPQADVPGAGS